MISSWRGMTLLINFFVGFIRLGGLNPLYLRHLLSIVLTSDLSFNCLQ